MTINLPPTAKRHATALLLGACAAAFFCQALGTSLRNSPAWDEPYHIASGLLFLDNGRIVRLSNHTPLLREMAGLSMRVGGVRLPPGNVDAAKVVAGTADLMAEYRIGEAVLRENGPDKVLFWARLPFVLMGTALIFLLYGLGKALLGEAAGLAAAFLYAFDPILLSNSSIAYTDTGLTFFVVLFVWALWTYLKKPDWVRLSWCGVALGAALSSKFTAVILLPAAALLLAADAILPAFAADAPPAAAVARRLLRHALALVAMGVLAVGVIQYVYLLPEDVFFYARGFLAASNELGFTPDYPYYMAGQYGPHFQSYLALGWLLKEPLATVLLTIGGAVFLVRRKRIGLLPGLFLALPAFGFFAGLSLLINDAGIRYIAPVLPFTLLVGGAGLAALAGSRARWLRGLATLFGLWLVVAAAGIHPDAMSYFNEAACLLDASSKTGLDGGTRCGPTWLDDTNVDSGQGLRQLREWLDTHAPGRPITFGYFGSIDPALYGVPLRHGDYARIQNGPPQGLSVVSAHIVARARPGKGSNGATWLLNVEPVAFVAHSYYVYDVETERFSPAPTRK
jgi:hypothetical protein